jgi:glycogen synthase
MAIHASVEERRVKQEQKPSVRSFLRELIVGWQPTRQQVLWAIRIIIVLVVLLSILTLIGSEFNKPLWSWLQLLIVPATITVVGAAVGAWFTQQRARETVLQTYLDKMTELITDKQLHDHEFPYHPTRVTARARTLATLLQLDGDRKKSVVQFLYEVQLINKNKKHLSGHEFEPRIVGLSGADLTNANLRYLTLQEAALDGALLGNADLRNAQLSRIDLGGAFLSAADLRSADLTGASLRNAHLGGASLSAADLRGADLTGASLRKAQLQRKEGLSASKLSGADTRYTDFWDATMPDGTLFQDALFQDDSKAAMRILHVTTELPPYFDGGLGTAVAGMVKVSMYEGLTPAVLLLDPHPHGGNEYSSSSYSGNGSGASGNGVYGVAGFLSHHPSLGDEEGGVLPRAGLLLSAPQAEDIDALIERAEAWQPDIVHLHSVELWWVADVIRKEARAPLVYTVHSLQLAEYEIGGQLSGLELWPSQREAITSATRVIVVSQSERRLLDRACPEADAKIRVVGNGIDDATTTEEPDWRVAGEEVEVLYVGRFAERKGVRELLQAIPTVLAASDNVRFVLIGGYRHATGAAMAADWLPPALRSLRTRVHFTGWLAPHEVDTWYRKADILVVPSRYEPQGMVVLEGMMHELPIAASAVGGPSEILVHEETGLLFEPRNVEALANAILRLVNDPPLRQRLGSAAAKEVRKRWLWSQIIARDRDVYEEVLADQ